MENLTDDQALMLESIREFNEQEVESRVLSELEQDVFAPELIDRMDELGLLSISLPEEFGGLGESMVTQALVEEELAKKSMTVAMMASAGTLVAKTLAKVGTDEQREKLLPLLKGKPVGFALTEPSTGSDVASMTTTAARDGDEWVINGQKTFISFAEQSDYLAVGARTNETGDGGISMFLVPTNTPGFKIGSVFDKLGWHASSTAEVFLEDVRVPALNMIGKENKGMHVALGLLDEARVGVAATAVGMCEAAIQTAANFAKDRIVFGKPVAAKQGIQWYLAEMDVRTAAARALLYQAARNFDEGRPVGLDAARAKLFATDALQFVATKAVQICGGMGLMRDFGLERFYRDAKVLSIIEGTDEVQKMVISRNVLA